MTTYTAPSIAESQDLVLVGGSEANGVTECTFRRRLDTGDASDRAIVGGGTEIVWAVHPSDDRTALHTQRGSGRVDFLADDGAGDMQSVPAPAAPPVAPTQPPTESPAATAALLVPTPCSDLHPRRIAYHRHAHTDY